VNLFPLPFVLDTNTTRFERLPEIKALAKRGFRLRIAETAFAEWTAACVRGWKREGWSRQEARSKYFGRARAIAPFLDADLPVAPDGGSLARRIVAEADGALASDEGDGQARQLREFWADVSGIGITDEEFIHAGTMAETFLDELDSNFISLARREQDLRKNPRSPDVGPAERKAGYQLWDAMSSADRLTHLRRFVRETLHFSPAAAERLDAHVCTFAYRLHMAALGERMPKQNDGGDISLPVHLGAGCFLITQEKRLVDIVDQSGTFQAPWVRRLNDLDDLPEGLPWGDSARRESKRFARRR
jgi:hypothetical protein